MSASEFVQWLRGLIEGMSKDERNRPKQVTGRVIKLIIEKLEQVK
jgi:hypothetical protein